MNKELITIIKHTNYDELIIHNDVLMMEKSLSSSTVYTYSYQETLSSPNSNKHCHQAFEILYVMHGEVMHEIEGQKIIHNQGEVCLLNPLAIHHEDLGEDARVLFINLSISFVQELLKTHLVSNEIKNFLNEYLIGQRNNNYLVFTPVSSHELLEIEAMQSLFQHNDDIATYQMKGLFLRMFDDLSQKYLYQTNKLNIHYTHEQFIYNQVIHFISLNHGICTRKDVSNYLHYHEDYINVILKKIVGKTLYDLILEFKIKYAMELLKHTTLTVSDIIYKLGYQSTTHFQKHFKDATGTTMKQFRLKNK